MSKQQLALAIGASGAYLAWYAYRKWSFFQGSARNAAAHCSVVDSVEAWSECRADVLGSIKSSNMVTVDFLYSYKRLDPKMVALFSLTTSTNRVVIIRPRELFYKLPRELEAVLSDPSVITVGVNLLEHVAILKENCKVSMRGCLDLRNVALTTSAAKAKLVKATSDLSLSSMTKVLLGSVLSEDDEVHNSQWDAPTLSNAQFCRAATRAVTAFRLTTEIARSHGLVTRAVGTLLQPYLWLEHRLRCEYGAFVDFPFELQRLTRHILPVQTVTAVQKQTCMVCGSCENIVFKFLVPEEYQAHLPEDALDELDVVHICTTCEYKSYEFDDLMRQTLQAHCGPTKGFNQHQLKVYRAATGLLVFNSLLTDDIRSRYEKLLKATLNVTQLDHEIVKHAEQLAFSETIEDLKEHGEMVVEHFARHEGVAAFANMWREYFLEKMQPLYPDSIYTA